MKINFLLCRNPRTNVVWEFSVEVRMVTPSLPQKGRQPKGSRPLDPRRYESFGPNLPARAEGSMRPPSDPEGVGMLALFQSFFRIKKTLELFRFYVGHQRISTEQNFQVC